MGAYLAYLLAGARPLLVHILGFLTDARSRHRAALACHRLLAAERATRAVLSLRGDPRLDAFLYLIRPSFCFPALERLDLSLVSPWGHPFLSSAAPSRLSSSCVGTSARPRLDSGTDLEPLLGDCPALRALDLSEFYCWTEDIEPLPTSRRQEPANRVRDVALVL
ncbi:F-box/LRR-repeat MAX2 homolog [Miscanthus floridulus]|uniref:F-box/LRR-repeat MAX2 homolog n=1 Tax=Miscanthus floridulus TaxID=154761 RepID=UPI00345A9A59